MFSSTLNTTNKTMYILYIHTYTYNYVYAYELPSVNGSWDSKGVQDPKGYAQSTINIANISFCY